MKKIYTKQEQEVINILGIENKIDNKYVAISDIQLGQQNLLLYEYENRYKKEGLGELSIDELQKLKDNKNYNDGVTCNTNLSRILKQSDNKVVEHYFNYIKKDNSVKYIIDGGDFLFKPNEARINYFRKNFSVRFKEEKKILDGKVKILLLGNHDKENYINFYLEEFFDEVRYYVFYFEGRSLYIFTHEPITEKSLKMKKFQPLDILLKDYIYSMKDYFTEIVNIHGHTHSSGIKEQYDGGRLSDIKYENMCLDYYNQNNFF